MATAPVKSQPLHNFSLPFLKWGHRNQVNNNHRFRRPSESTARNSPPSMAEHQHPEADSESESENRKLSVGSRTARNRFSVSSCSSQKQQTDVLETERNNEGDVAREKEEKVFAEVDGEELVAKPWNLRPRKVAAKVATEIGSSKNGELHETSAAVLEIPVAPQSESLPKSMRLRGFVEGQGSERAEKRRLWISLSREEIEEDVYSLTGSRPARRPKKRPKNVQKQLDSVFPGLYLVGVTADSYRVHDHDTTR